MFVVLWPRFFLTWLGVFFYPDWGVFQCFSLSCKANARVKLSKTGHGLHSSTLVVTCVVLLLFVLFCVLFVCKCVLPPGDNPIAVNKYIKIIHLEWFKSPNVFAVSCSVPEFESSSYVSTYGVETCVTINELWTPKNLGNVLNCWGTVSFSRRSLLHGVS
jgi:hypothetical protein